MHRSPTDIWIVKTEVQKRGENFRLTLGSILEVVIEAMKVNRFPMGDE